VTGEEFGRGGGLQLSTDVGVGRVSPRTSHHSHFHFYIHFSNEFCILLTCF
jgi:hypothetical protein